MIAAAALAIRSSTAAQICSSRSMGATAQRREACAMPQITAPLRLDSTGQYLGGPLVGAHDNRKPAAPELRRQLAQLLRVTGH